MYIIMSKKGNSIINVWDIIDTYFRDIDYYKSQHQVDSFDEFIFSNENGVKNIIKRENPFILFKGENSNIDDKFSYEINVYFGETLNENGELIDGVENIFVTSPSLYTDDKTLTTMFPNDARLKNLTYKGSVLCNIGVKYIFHNEGGRTVIKNFEKVNIGSIPIMLHSRLCLLHKLDDIKLSEFGECPYDQGGYFIVNGKEKVILSQEKKVNNILYINKSGDENIILEGNIKSISNEGFQSSRTNHVSYIRNSIRSNLGNNKVERKENTFIVRILGLDIKVPLFILFRALGYETDKKIIETIIYDNHNYELRSKIYDL